MPPWEKYQGTSVTPDASGPWARYDADTKQPSVGSDIAKSLGVGLGQGLMGAVALPGNIVSGLQSAEDWLAQTVRELEVKPPASAPATAPATPPAPPKIPLPPPIKPRLHMRRGPK